MASRRRSSDDISIMADEDDLVSPRREADQSQVSLQEAVKAILEGGLAAQIKTVVQQQAALVFGELSDVRDSTPGPSGVSRRAESEGGRDVRRSRQAILIGGEIVDHFNPEDKDAGIDRWLNTIDQLGDIHGWSEYDRLTIMQAKLAGTAKKWYHQLDRYDFSWTQWKVQLRQAFPRRHDFAVMMEEMMARRKRQDETMTSYYHAKLALCGRVDVKGESAVSCIIRGLPEELRANAYAAGCTSPEALYHQFLAGLESYNREAARQTEGVGRPVKRAVPHTKALVRCYNCQEETTHLSKDCPKERVDRCWTCGEGGHLSKECTKRRAQHQATRSTTKVSLVVKATDSVFRQRGVVNGEAIRVYIDTGSEANIMSAQTARRLGLTLDLAKSGVVLSGFGGGVAESLGEVRFDLVMANLELATKALVTDSDMGRIELLLGQEAIRAPGVTLVVRNNKALLTNEGDSNDFFRRMELEGDPARCHVVLDEDLTVGAGESKKAKVRLEGGRSGNSVYMCGKKYTVGQSMVVIPSAVLVCGEADYLHVTNLGEADIHWKRGRLISRADPCRADGAQKPQVNVFNITRGRCLDLSRVKVGDVSEACKGQLLKLLREKSCCFSRGDDDVGLTHLGEMQIRLTTDVPVFYRPYRLSLAERRLVQEKVHTMLEAGVIRESESAFASPIVLIPKKTGEVRLCVNYRALNAITVKDRYPLPLIADQLDKLANKRYFSTLDLAQGYHQVSMHPDSVDKTAFVTPDGHYEYLRVPFGLANSPAVFQRIINKMLGNLRFDQVLAYMDDLLIPSCTPEQGLALLRTVLSLVEQAGVKLKLEKCSFLMQEVDYLGHEISADGIQPGRRKIEAVVDFPTPGDVHSVRQFVGLASYFRKFVQNFSTVAKPLTDLTKKDVPWRWESEQQSAFQRLKSCLASRPLLALYDSKAETELHTDASKLGLGGILLQRSGENQGWRPVEYFSRATTTSEQVWHSYELETLALVESVRRFRVYLLGIKFKVVTDCVAVRATLLKRDLVPRIARWWLAIQEYDMVVEYRSGGRMQHVDALSRNPSRGGETASGVESGEGVGICVVSLGEVDWFLTVQMQDPKAQYLVEALRSGQANRDLKATFKVKNGRLYRITLNGDRLYVPAMARFGMVRKHHDDIGHPGYERCLALLKETYWFPKMSRFVLKYVKSCLRCAFAKGDYGRGEGYLHPIDRRPVPFDTVHIDHLGPFVRSVGGNSYILVMVDGFTKFVLAKPTRTLRSTEAITKLREIFGEFGYPRRIISDRGLAFTSKLFQEFVAEKGIRHVLNSIATPRANGQVERANRTIVQALAASAETECRWEERLPDIVWGLNNTVNASTRFSPVQLMFSHSRGVVADLAGGELASEAGGTSKGPAGKAIEARGAGGLATPCEQGGTEADQQDDDLVGIAGELRRQQLQARREKAGENIRKTAKKMKARYDRRRKVATRYRVGDLVLWQQASTNQASLGVNRKLANKYDGPFRVVKALGNDRYQIEAIKGVRGYKRFTAVVAVDSLRRYHSVNQGVGDITDDDHPGDEVDRCDLIDLLEG